MWAVFQRFFSAVFEFLQRQVIDHRISRLERENEVLREAFEDATTRQQRRIVHFKKQIEGYKDLVAKMRKQLPGSGTNALRDVLRGPTKKDPSDGNNEGD